MKVLVAGELNPDLILGNCHIFPELGKEVLVDDLTLTLGSSSAICAAGFARLGDSVTFAGVVGADTYGDFCIDALRKSGVDVSLVQRRPGLKTGITVSITSVRDRALVTYPGAITALRADDLPDTVFAGHQHFHVSSWFLQDGLRSGLKGLFAAAHRAGLTTSLDSGYDPSEQWATELLLDTLTEVDVFLPNEMEIKAITGQNGLEASVRDLDDGRLLIVAKLGAQGCIARHRGESIRANAFPVEVVDTTGAGDSFNAGFLHAWQRGEPLDDCLRFAGACGALSTRGMGGCVAQPSEEDVQGFLEAQSGNRFHRTA